MTRLALPGLLLLAAAAALLIALTAGRKDEAAATPRPVTMSDEALGYYCQMLLIEHPGPKGQIHLDGVAEPIFFSQARDTIAYLRMPEQSYPVLATYVSDMGAAESWDQPGRDNWIPAAEAFYVVGSSRVGGMGAPEAVPFGERAAADAFARDYGGSVLRLDEIDDALVLAPVEIDPDAEGAGQEHHQHPEPPEK
jgi:copper chaperone NosL